jgi:hypothetical protein
MAPLTYTGLEFFLLSRIVSIESLTDYSIRLESAFGGQYQIVGFSREEFVETFAPHLKNYDPHSNVGYRFDVGNADCRETWQIKLRLTQISHFEGGIVRADPGDLNRRLTLGRDLIKLKLADNLSVSEFVKAKGIQRLLGKTIAGRLIGEPLPIYLWQRVLAINSLRQKLRWESRGLSSFDFFGFADRIASAFQPDDTQIVELSYGPETDEIPVFMQNYDEQLKSHLDTDDLKKTFALINISPDEWFSS